MASIKKWEKNAEATNPKNYKIGWKDCPLCVLFIDSLNCEGCLVKKKTGMGGCNNTPYYDAAYELNMWFDGSNGDSAREAAKEEVEFLESLLPEGKIIGTSPSLVYTDEMYLNGTGRT